MTRAADEGSTSVVVLALCLGAVSLLALIALLGAAATVNARAAGAADLAALAAAETVLSGSSEDPCRTAEDIAARNGAELTECIVRPDLRRVGVSVEAPAPGRLKPASGHAVAGWDH